MEIPLREPLKRPKLERVVSDVRNCSLCGGRAITLREGDQWKCGAAICIECVCAIHNWVSDGFEKVKDD